MKLNRWINIDNARESTSPLVKCEKNVRGSISVRDEGLAGVRGEGDG
jgi:hypothetical protein